MVNLALVVLQHFNTAPSCTKALAQKQTEQTDGIQRPYYTTIQMLRERFHLAFELNTPLFQAVEPLVAGNVLVGVLEERVGLAHLLLWTP